MGFATLWTKQSFSLYGLLDVCSTFGRVHVREVSSSWDWMMKEHSNLHGGHQQSMYEVLVIVIRFSKGGAEPTFSLGGGIW